MIFLLFYQGISTYRDSLMLTLYPCNSSPATLIVKDRPFSSYFSSMGGWRWKTFLKTLAAGFVIFGIPTIIKFLLNGKIADMRFAAGGLILLILLIPLQAVAEELLYRGFITQTVSSWFKLPVAGLIVQTIVFAAIHPYNTVGVISVATSAVIYGLICIYSRGIESSTALHIMNNLIQLIMGGLGFGILTAEQSVSSTLFNAILKLLFLAFIIYADKKLHWFDEVQRDDIEPFNEKHAPK